MVFEHTSDEDYERELNKELREFEDPKQDSK